MTEETGKKKRGAKLGVPRSEAAKQALRHPHKKRHTRSPHTVVTKQRMSATYWKAHPEQNPKQVKESSERWKDPAYQRVQSLKRWEDPAYRKSVYDGLEKSLSAPGLSAQWVAGMKEYIRRQKEKYGDV